MKIQLPELPTSFTKTALDLPRKIDGILAKLTEADDVVDVMDQVEAREHFARRIKADTPVVNALVCARLKSIAAWARLSPRQERGRGKISLGGRPFFAKQTVATYRKVGDSAGRIDEYAEKATGEGLEISPKGFLDFVGKGGVLATRHNNDVIEWYTPERYIEAARKAMGSIDLDPASSKAAQKTVKASRYYTAKDDGLTQPWEGNVFLNPPYKMPLVDQFCARLCEEYASKAVTQAVLLVNDNTDTKWWHRAANTASVICIHLGRISFYNDAGEWSSPTNGQTVFYLGRATSRFAKVFKEFGLCIRKSNQR